MRWTALVAFALVAGCAQQDAALSISFQGGYRIPQDADMLVVDIFDGANEIKRSQYPLSAGMRFPLTLTVVESGGSHSHVRINATVSLSGQAVGIGRQEADFASGKTVPVTLSLVPPG